MTPALRWTGHKQTMYLPPPPPAHLPIPTLSPHIHQHTVSAGFWRSGPRRSTWRRAVNTWRGRNIRMEPTCSSNTSPSTGARSHRHDQVRLPSSTIASSFFPSSMVLYVHRINYKAYWGRAKVGEEGDKYTYRYTVTTRMTRSCIKRLGQTGWLLPVHKTSWVLPETVKSTVHGTWRQVGGWGERGGGAGWLCGVGRNCPW